MFFVLLLGLAPRELTICALFRLRSDMSRAIFDAPMIFT